MPADKVFTTFLGVEVGFLVTGTVMIIFALKTQAEESRPFTANNVARDLLLQECPVRATIANAILIFATFLLGVPGILMQTSRGWLKAHGAMVVVCMIFTLVIGLDIWFETLKTRENLGLLWNQQSNDVQSLLQRELNCCGYLNSTSPPFIQDSVCLNPQVALAKGGCVKAFSSYGNDFLDIVFTGAFGIVGYDVIVLLLITIVLKDRKEKERYRHIDQKNGVGRF